MSSSSCAHRSGRPSASKPYPLFVYGTLRRGGRNHHLLEGADYKKEAQIAGYMMWSFGSFPGVVSASPNQVIRAELYHVDEGLLARIDRLEDFYGPDDPRNIYERVSVRDSENRTGFLYIFVQDRLQQPPFKQSKRLIPGGDWINRT